MNISKYIIDFVASSITVFLELLAYNNLFNNRKFKYSFRNIILVLFFSSLIMTNGYINGSLIRAFVNFILLLISAVIIYKDDIKVSLANLLVCHILIVFYEILLSSVIIMLNIFDLESFDGNSIIKAVFSFIVLLASYFTCKTSFVRKIASKFSNKSVINKALYTILLMFMIVLIIFDFKYSVSFSNNIYIGNIILIICFSVFLYISIKSNIKVEKEIEKSEVLLNFMSKYEKMIDDSRVNRHELLNNLLMLKSIKDKNSQEYDSLLDDLIDKSTNKGMSIRNIYKLPSGLKGIFYYKLYGLEEYNISINISKNVSKKIKNINYDDYVVLYRMVGIVLDNAIEASSKTKDKLIMVDIYSEKNIIYIEISNSFKGKVNLSKINNKDYSTKGKNRGLGLYILKNLSQTKESIEVIQSVNKNIFTTKIVIKEK